MKKPPTSKPEATTTKQRTKDVSEYRLLIAPHFNERVQKYTTLLVLETAKAFASYQYELSVDETAGKKSFHYRVKGLKTPHLSLPTSGHAQFRREYEDLRGTYQITVEGLDGRANTFSVRITPELVKLVSTPPDPFIRVVTNTTLWSNH